MSEYLGCMSALSLQEVVFDDVADGLEHVRCVPEDVVQEKVGL